MGISFSNFSGGISSSSNGFSLLVGDTGNTTYSFTTAQPAGAYSINSQLGDTTFDIYLIAADNSNVGYTNNASLEATDKFVKVVLYGATTDDIINFEYKPSASPTASGNVEDGAAPFLTSATPVTLSSVDDTTTVTGGNFANDVQIIFTGQDDVDRAAKNIVRSDSTSLIVTRPDEFPVAQEPYSMTATNTGITNPSTSVNKLTNYFDAGGGITWSTGATLPSVLAGDAYSTTIEAIDADGNPVEYALTAGSLPVGLSLNGTTGVISGTPTGSGGSAFTVTATDSGNNSASREFTINVISTTTDYLVIAGGGSGGSVVGGGGGAGGMRCTVTGTGGSGNLETPFTFAVSTNYTITVGAGAAPTSQTGSNSVFGSIAAAGGGGGGNYENNAGKSGGSGGGGSGWGSTGTVVGGTATPTGQGFDGGSGIGNSGPGYAGGGGGGASAAGNNATAGVGGAGGAGRATDITGTLTTYAGGGGGASDSNIAAGGIGGGGASGKNPSTPATDGSVNTGGGGGGRRDTASGGAGGSGIVVLKYSSLFTIIPGPGLVVSFETSNGYTVATFTGGSDTITFELSSSVAMVEYLVIAGGGGGGRMHGAGGGAGGYRSSVSGESSGGGSTAETALYVLTGTNVPITVGAGGPGQLAGQLSSDGTNSIFSTITSVGGGGGGGYNNNNTPTGTLNGHNGGSGGGSWSSATIGTGTANQGFDGGTGIGGGAYAETTGGGGGAGGVGGSSTTAGGPCGAGGPGVSSSITGSAVVRAGGGGGGAGGNGNTSGGAGGTGGGGQGGIPVSGSTDGGSGQVNTGSGGGGSSYISNFQPPIGIAGNGASGVVILRYPAARTLNIGAGLTASTSTIGENKVTVFTAGSDTISVS